MSPILNFNFTVVWSIKTDRKLNWRQCNIHFSSCCAIAIYTLLYRHQFRPSNWHSLKKDDIKVYKKLQVTSLLNATPQK